MTHKSRYQLAAEVRTLAARDGISTTEAKRRVEIEYLIEQINGMSLYSGAMRDIQEILRGIVRLL